MPSVFAELVDRGALFNRGYVNTPFCCPSRSEILTGMYQHHSGVEGQHDPLTRPTIVQALHDLGYRTSLAGKYLNSWPCDPRPEFDRWMCADNKRSPQVDPELNVDGTWTQFTGYTTDILAAFSADFIAATPADQPFFVMYTPPSPHLPANDDRCDDLPVQPHRPPSFDEDTETSGKPNYMQRGPLTAEEIATIDHNHEAMTQSVVCMDPAVDTVLASLGDREPDTLVFFLSDNGFLYGEHRRSYKQVPYEESVRVPFVVRYPPLIPETQPFVSNALVQTIDITPTIAELVGIDWGADGISLVPLLSGDTAVRDSALIEWCQVSSSCNTPPPHSGVVTEGFKYVEYSTGEKELYDLTNDPYELTNVAGMQEWADIEAELANELAALRVPPPTETTIVTGPQSIVGPGPHTFTYFSQSRFATYRCRVRQDGVRGRWFSCNGQSITVGPLTDGPKTFQVAGTDENGVSDGTPATRSFAVYADAPTVTGTSAPLGPRRGRDVYSYK